jgi:tight adherence protein B
MDTYLILVVSGSAMLSVFLLYVGVLTIRLRQNESVDRLRNFTAPQRARAGDSALVGAIAGMDSWLTRRNFGANIARNLAQADMKLTVTEYVLLHVGLFALGLPLGALALKTPIASLPVALIMLFVPGFYVSSARGKRLKAFNEQIPSALDSLSNSLRGGYGLVQAMSLVAAELPAPMSVEMQRVVSEVSYGLPYDLSFKNMLRRNPGTDLSMVVTAIEINLEVGGNLAEILDNIGAIIRDRIRIQGQIHAYTAQARFSGLVLTALPFLLAALIYVTNPAYLSQLWTTTFGLIMIGVAAVMMVLGSLVMNKIAQIDF